MLSIDTIKKPQGLVSVVLLLVLSFWSLMALANTEISIKSGQTIIKIMRQEYPDQRNRWPLLMRKMVELNPSAFVNGDPRTLKSGALIKLPEKATVQKSTEKRVRAATVYKIVGSVTLFDDRKKIQPIKVGSIVYVGDQLLTSDKAVLRLQFIDGATVKLRCNSLLNIDEYKMRSRGSVSELSLLKGSLRTKSGRIGRRDNDRYLLKTPLGNITTGKAEYGVRVLQSQGCEQQADVDTDGLYLDVLNGKVSLANAGKKHHVASGDAALISDKTSTPVAVNAFSGMVFGEKLIEKPRLNNLTTEPQMTAAAAAEDDATKPDDGVPVWWMLASLLILGVAF